ncbi:hypothetical protein IDM40_08285 [Nocardiopsis sp. HNM0947]|uniref:Lipoprotein n=1 Tax=Nocardiopsis coralli TaxID=2772213 RepID=A0ABR9P4D6_9ACTN|nr:hypothetical protein [Nocardiopsis coralli]MBE2998701.1 hypothetical protein [Nocardiopsis coralli]
MKRDARSTALALVASGLVIVGSAACSPQEISATLLSPGSEQSAENAGAEAESGNLSGQVEFLSPGEFIIDDQAFLVGENTQITGGINACPAVEGIDTDGIGTVECDLESFEAAVQGDTDVFAEVALGEEGVAESITEYAQDGQAPAEPEDPEAAPEDGDGEAGEAGGFTGTAAGELEYRSPGEYSIDGTTFYVAEDTQITAGNYACAGGVQDPDTGEVTCDFDDFDATLANGTAVLATVDIVDGIAESITEYEA